MHGIHRPRHTSHPTHAHSSWHKTCRIVDAKRNDPTRTFSLRAKMRAEGDRRWQTLAQVLRSALIEHDIIGQRGMSKLPFGDKTEGFSMWLREELRQKVFGHDGRWLKPYVQQAAAHAQTRADEMLGVRDAAGIKDATVDPARVTAMESLAVSELAGVCAAAQQQITRAVTHCMMANATPTATANAAAGVVKVMRNRTRAMSEYIVAKTHATSTLSAFRSAGIRRVGIDPERIRKTTRDKILLKDRRYSGPGSRSREETPSARTIGRIEEVQEGLEEELGAGEVDVVNGPDPCPICEEIADDGPYDLDEAEDLIPQHPFCMCAFTLAGEDDDDTVDFNPNHDPHSGEFTGGEGDEGKTPVERAQVERIKENVHAAADDLGFDKSRIDFVHGTRQFDVNGVSHTAAGDADISKGDEGRIRIWLDHVTPEWAPGLTAHEIEHEKFQKAIDSRRRDADMVMKEPGPPPDPTHKYWWGREGGSAAVMSPDGSLKPPYDAKYPFYTAMHMAIDRHNLDDFAKGDGVSDYSAEYWKGVQDGKVSTELAMHETLAEMARLKYTTGKFPEHYGYSRMISERLKGGAKADEGGYAPKASGQAKGTKMWRNLYRTVDDIHKGKIK